MSEIPLNGDPKGPTAQATPVEQEVEDILCPICYSQVWNPQTCPICKDVFCLKCGEANLKRLLSDNKPYECHICRSNLRFVPLNGERLARFLKIIRTCSKCPIRLPVLEQTAHEAYCQFEKCSREQCLQKARVMDGSDYFCSYYCKVYRLAEASGTLGTPEVQKELENAEKNYRTSYPVTWGFSPNKHYFKRVADDVFEVDNPTPTRDYQTMISKVGLYRGRGTFLIEIHRNPIMHKSDRSKFSYKVGVTTQAEVTDDAPEFPTKDWFVMIDSKLGYRSWSSGPSNVLTSNPLDQHDDNELRVDFAINSQRTQLSIQINDQEFESLEEIEFKKYYFWYPTFSYCQNMKAVKATLTNLGD